MGRFVYSVIFLAILLLSSADAAYIHGKVYEWFSLDELDNVVIDVNSIPGQRHVSKNGNYEFSLPVGSYNIHAEYFEDSGLKYAADENILIVEDGNYIIDIIMFPALGDSNGQAFDVPDIDLGIGNDFGKNGLNPAYIAIALIALVAAICAVFILFRRQISRIERNAAPIRWDGEGKKPEAREIGQRSQQYNPDKYATEVIEALRKSGNRLTQKELRDKVTSIGEAKISLILSELEDAGMVKKIKRGRGNIIILREH